MIHREDTNVQDFVYQIEADCVRLLWVGKDRTKHSFEKFFVLIGEQAAGKSADQLHPVPPAQAMQDAAEGDALLYCSRTPAAASHIHIGI